MRSAVIVGGVVGQIRASSDAAPGSQTVPAYVQENDTTPDGGVTFYRAGQLLADTGYPIPVGDLFRDLTDAELASVLRIAFPTLTDAQVGALVFLFRCVAQTELSSIDPRVIAARTAFGPLLGADRIAHLFRQR